MLDYTLVLDKNRTLITDYTGLFPSSWELNQIQAGTFARTLRALYPTDLELAGYYIDFVFGGLTTLYETERGSEVVGRGANGTDEFPDETRLFAGTIYQTSDIRFRRVRGEPDCGAYETLLPLDILDAVNGFVVKR